MTEDGSGPSNYVGIDIGGTFTRLAVVDEHGRVMADRRTETPSGDDGLELIGWLEKAYHVCRGETDSNPEPEVIGIAVPGILEPGRSVVMRAVNLPFLEGLPVAELLTERTGLVTVVDCDSVAAAWGEFCARERRPKRMVYLTIGTGVGVAVIIDGAVVRHTHHSVGHWGHVVCDMGEDAPVCACGARGCVEACIAGPALHAAARAAGFEGGLDRLEEAVQEGDTQAIEWVHRKSGDFALMLRNLAIVYSPDVVVVGGGVASVLPSLVRYAGEMVRKSAGSLLPERFRVELSALADCSGVVGMALSAADFVRSARGES